MPEQTVSGGRRTGAEETLKSRSGRRCRRRSPSPAFRFHGAEAHGDETGTAIALRFCDVTRSLPCNGATLVKTIGDAVMITAPEPAISDAIILELQIVTDSTPNFAAPC